MLPLPLPLLPGLLHLTPPPRSRSALGLAYLLPALLPLPLPLLPGLLPQTPPPRCRSAFRLARLLPPVRLASFTRD